MARFKKSLALLLTLCILAGMVAGFGVSAADTAGNTADTCSASLSSLKANNHIVPFSPDVTEYRLQTANGTKAKYTLVWSDNSIQKVKYNSTINQALMDVTSNQQTAEVDLTADGAETSKISFYLYGENDALLKTYETTYRAVSSERTKPLDFTDDTDTG